jgi:osmotically-inducible protein OsmY
MRTNTQLQKTVLAELEWEPRVDASNIGVAAAEGVVTLTGHVKSYPEKIAAERAVKRVSGVRGVANDIDVKLPDSSERGDTELVQAALKALEWDVMVPSDRITVRAANGWLTLEGDVEWEYQRNAAERAVRHLTGVRGCANAILLKPRASESQVKQHIEAALKRRAEFDARQLKVAVDGGKVTLKGAVHSWREHDDALNAAWDASGVSAVHDELTIAL